MNHFSGHITLWDPKVFASVQQRRVVNIGVRAEMYYHRQSRQGTS